MNNFSEKVSFIWSVADLLRGPYRPNQYKDVMLPMTVLRRLDCVLEPTKEKVLDSYKEFMEKGPGVLEKKLERVTGMPFYNTSRYIFEELIRRFNEASNEEAGDHFTPCEVIRLMVNLLFLAVTGKIDVREAAA